MNVSHSFLLLLLLVENIFDGRKCTARLLKYCESSIFSWNQKPNRMNERSAQRKILSNDRKGAKKVLLCYIINTYNPARFVFHILFAFCWPSTNAELLLLLYSLFFLCIFFFSSSVLSIITDILSQD